MGSLDPDSQARFFYLAILAMVIASGMFWRYRGRLGEGVQHLAIWALLIVGLVIAYGFKDELMGQLRPDRAALVDADTVVLRRARGGHFQATLEIDGEPVRFLVDTGASQIALSRRDAERIGFDLDALAFTQPAATANGMVWGAPVRLDRVEFGPFTDYDVAAVVNGGELHRSLLGMSYLDRFGRLAIEGDRLTLSR